MIPSQGKEELEVEYLKVYGMFQKVEYYYTKCVYTSTSSPGSLTNARRVESLLSVIYGS